MGDWRYRALLLVLAGSLSGCLAWPVRCVKRLDDPQTAHAVPVRSESGGCVMLPDGSRALLAGISTDGMKGRQFRALMEAMERPTSCGVMQACLVQRLSNGRVYVVQTNRDWPYGDMAFWPFFPLIPIPIYQWRHPIRHDVAMDLVREGLVSADLESLKGVRPVNLVDGERAPSLAELERAFAEAELLAKTKHWGIHRTPTEELADLARNAWTAEEGGVAELLEEGADPNQRTSRGDSAAEVAVALGQTSLLNMMACQGARLNWDALLSYAAEARSSSEVIWFLRRQGARIRNDAVGTELLLIGCRDGNEGLISEAAAAGVDLNRAGRDRVPPLHEAVRNGRIEAVSYLRDLGADMNVRDAKGRTPMDVYRHLKFPSTEMHDALTKPRQMGPSAPGGTFEPVPLPATQDRP